MQALVIFGVVQTLIFWWLLSKITRYLPDQKAPDALYVYLFCRSAKNGGLNKQDLTWTAVASYFQAATSLILGFEYGYYYGLLVVMTALFFGIGIFIFWYALSNAGENHNNLLQKAKFPFDVILSGQRLLARLFVNVLVYMVIPFTAIIELWYGSSVIESIYRGINIETGSGFAGFDGLFGLAIFVFISCVLFFYVYIGGYRSIVATDKPQVILIVIMQLFFVVGAMSAVNGASGFELNRFLIGFQGAAPDTRWFWLLSFVIGAITLNGLWQFVEPQQWHRAATASDMETYKKSLPVAAISTCALWAVPAFFGALFAAYNVSSEGLSRITALPFIAFHNLMPFSWLGQLLLALACAGVIAAALSSADTVIMAFVARIASLFGQENFSFKQAQVLSGIISLIVIGVAWILYVNSPQIINVIFALFPAQLFFFWFFWRYIQTGGHLVLKVGGLSWISLGYAACLLGSFSLNIFPNMWPSVIQPIIPSIGLIFPIFIIVIGVIVCLFSTELATSDDSRARRLPLKTGGKL